MGLVIGIYRDRYIRDALAVFKDVERLTLVNVEGPFKPTPDAPAARLAKNGLGNPVIVPDENPKGPLVGPMFGGSYGATSDSRFKPGFYGAVPIHDRYETPEVYALLR